MSVKPPSATSRMRAPVLGCRSTAILQCLQQVFPIEECKVTPHFVHVELVGIGLEQRAQVVEIADSRWVVDVALQFEGDEPFRTDDAEATEAGLALVRLAQQPSSRGPVGIEHIEAVSATQIVGGIRAAVNASIADSKQDIVQSISVVGIDQEIDIARRAHDAMRCQREPTDRRRRFRLRVRFIFLLT